MKKPWLAASVVMGIALFPFFALARHLPYRVERGLFGAIPIIGGAVGAFVAPRNKFDVGTGTALPAILLLNGGAYLASFLGLADSVGFTGTLVGVVWSLPIIVVGSVLGAFLGAWVSKRRANA